jgi:uncharacterized cupin superfamily protein
LELQESTVPKIDIAKAMVRTKGVYPEPWRAITEGREKTGLGDVVGLTQFGVNLTRLKPGAASALRHWHEAEDEFIYVLEGEIMLIEDGSTAVLQRRRRGFQGRGRQRPSSRQ